MKWLWLLALAATLALTYFLPRWGAGSSPHDFNLRQPPRPLPEIAVADGEGKIAALADFRGKFVLLNIWATWCGPCRKEMPTLDRLEGQLGGPDFEVVALSIDRKGADAVRKFYAEIGIQHLSVHIDASAAAPSALGAFGVPTTLFIDRQGREIGRLIGPAEWDSPEMIDFLKTKIAQQDRQAPSATDEDNPK